MIAPPTHSVTIRPVHESDAEALAELRRRNEPHLRPWQPCDPSMLDAATARATLRDQAEQTQRGEAFYGVTVVNGEVLGSISAHHLQRQYLATAWVGYWIDAQHTDQGHTTQAMRLLIDHCRDVLRLHRLEAFCQVTNPGSQKVLEHNGFTQCGMLPQHLFINDRWVDEYLYYLVLRGPQTPPYLTAARPGS